SPDADANRRFVDAVAQRLERLPKDMLDSVQRGPVLERKFFSDWRWIFAPRRDLLLIECEIRRESERASPFHLDLDEVDCNEEVEQALADTSPGMQEPNIEAEEDDAPEATGSEAAESEDSPLGRLRKRVERERQRLDRFPTGYFRNESGSI